ncbi:MAG: hypothetical protein ACK45H_11615 [Bacteroidota bacterium]
MKKNQLLILFAVLSLLFSCSDLQRKEHLAAIKGMRTSLDSLEKVLQDNQIDTLAGLITATMSLELRIKNNYESDTINMEFGRKMDAFKRARKRLKPIGAVYSNVRVGILEERDILKKLETDISNGNGNRRKYAEYVDFELRKIDQLRKLLASYVVEKEDALAEIDRLYPELNAYSLELLANKNKRTK